VQRTISGFALGVASAMAASSFPQRAMAEATGTPAPACIISR
jgi:hypothetical protein